MWTSKDEYNILPTSPFLLIVKIPIENKIEQFLFISFVFFFFFNSAIT